MIQVTLTINGVVEDIRYSEGTMAEVSNKVDILCATLAVDETSGIATMVCNTNGWMGESTLFVFDDGTKCIIDLEVVDEMDILTKLIGFGAIMEEQEG